MKARITVAALIGALAVLALPAISVADEATRSGYTPGTETIIDGTSASGAEPVDNGSGALAFTGRDIAFLLLSGVALLLIGFGVRRLAWPRNGGMDGTAAS